MRIRKPLLLIGSALVAIIAGAELISVYWGLSLWQGVYCSIGIATTEGCPITPQNKTAQIIALILMVITIPLIGAVFGLLQNMHLHKNLNLSIDKKLKDHKKEIIDTLSGEDNATLRGPAGTKDELQS